MEGRRSLKPPTLVRFQPSAPGFALAWCTMHRRIYKPLRSRSEHGLGSTPSASTMRSKLIRMSSRFLIGRQLVRFPYVPFVQWIRIERYERSDSGSSPERDTRF
jgi:hypothetical protein